jgi:hypothetical protein
MTERPDMDAFAASLYGDRVPPTRADRWKWFRRVGLPVIAVVAIIVAIAVVTDLPQRQSLAGERSTAASLITEVNGDVKTCAYAMGESVTIYRDWIRRNLSASDRSRVPSLLSQDAEACSFTSSSINDLSQIEEPGTGAGKYLANVLSFSMSWTTSDALGAIEDFSRLTAHPNNKRAADDLRDRAKYLAVDRGDALGALKDAERYLKGPLPALGLPKIAIPGA